MPNELKANAEFTDMDGRDWLIRLSIGLVRRIRDSHNVDLTKVFEPESGELDRLAADLDVFMAILADLIDSQLQAADVSLTALAEAMDGETVEAATEAILGGIVNFSPPHQRPPLIAILKRITPAMARMTKRTMEAIPVNQRIDDAMDAALGTPGKPSANSKPSPATAATTSASGN